MRKRVSQKDYDEYVAKLNEINKDSDLSFKKMELSRMFREQIDTDRWKRHYLSLFYKDMHHFANWNVYDLNMRSTDNKMSFSKRDGAKIKDTMETYSQLVNAYIGDCLLHDDRNDTVGERALEGVRARLRYKYVVKFVCDNADLFCDAFDVKPEEFNEKIDDIIEDDLFSDGIGCILNHCWNDVTARGNEKVDWTWKPKR